jgi:diadenosine tetraphosphate (Ap4A) HIT family hydrolase
LIETVQSLIAEFQLEDKGYRLITNGGPHQTIPQWHWHLVSEKANNTCD